MKLNLLIYSSPWNINLTKTVGIILQHFEAPHPLSNVHHVVLCGSCGCENNARTLRNYGKPAVIERYLQLSRNKYITIVGHVLCSADNSWEIDHILGSSAFKQRPTSHEVICCLLYSMLIMSYKYGNSGFFFYQSRWMRIYFQTHKTVPFLYYAYQGCTRIYIFSIAVWVYSFWNRS